MYKHIGATEDLLFDEDGAGIITSQQTLGKDFWDNLKEAQDEFMIKTNGLTAVASIPEALANKWLREGFDLWSAPAKEIVKKLRIDGYEKFIISGDTRF